MKDSTTMIDGVVCNIPRDMEWHNLMCKKENK